MVSLTEWKAILERYHHKCVICGDSEQQCGVLHKAHLKGKSKGGTQYLPMCPNHHTKYDKGILTVPELRKIGITDEKTYLEFIPRKTQLATVFGLNQLSVKQLKELADSVGKKIHGGLKEDYPFPNKVRLPPNKKDYVSGLLGKATIDDVKKVSQ